MNCAEKGTIVRIPDMLTDLLQSLDIMYVLWLGGKLSPEWTTKKEALLKPYVVPTSTSCGCSTACTCWHGRRAPNGCKIPLASCQQNQVKLNLRL